MATAAPPEAPPSAKKARSDYMHTREAFLDVYAVLRDEILADKLLEGQPADARSWMREMLDYNVPGGKLNRGMAVYDVLASIKGAEVRRDRDRARARAPVHERRRARVPRQRPRTRLLLRLRPQNLSKEEIFKANALGWCIEWLQAFFLVADDIMDGSITRRGQPCWYKQPKVGMVACNDYILLEACIYRILKAHFAATPGYARLLDLFLETTYQTAHGQLLDLTTAPPGAEDLSRYTMDAYLRIVTFKTAYYTFYLPVAAGLCLAGEGRPEAYDLARSVCEEMGRYFQIQDDYLDCYGDPAVIGKVGTDIEDAKCCWLVCTALQCASKAQRETIKANYGKKDAAAVAAVKAVYGELGIAAKFEAYEAASHAKLLATIEEQSLLPKPRAQPAERPRRRRGAAMAAANDEALAELEAQLRAPDSVLEVGVLDLLKEYLRAGGKPQSAIEDLSENYQGYAQMCDIMCQWLDIADVRLPAPAPPRPGGGAAGGAGPPPDGEVPDEFSLLQELAKERFDPTKFLGLFRRGAPTWLDALIAERRGRQLIYDLSASHRNSLLLNYAIQRILKQGHEDEVSMVGGSLASYFEVYHRLLATRLAAAARAASPAALAQLAAEVSGSCVGSQHTYVHAQQLLAAAAGWPGGGVFRRLSQEVEAAAVAKHGGAKVYQLLPLFVPLSAGPEERQAAQLVSEVLMRSAPTLPGGSGPVVAGAGPGAAAAQLAAAAAPLVQLHELYHDQAGAGAVPVDPLRHPQVMQLLLSGLFAAADGKAPGGGADGGRGGLRETCTQLLALAVAGSSREQLEQQQQQQQGLGPGGGARDTAQAALERGASPAAVAPALSPGGVAALLHKALALAEQVGAARLRPADLEDAAEVCKQPVAALGLLQHSRAALSDEALYAEDRIALVLPNHLSLLHRVACEQPSLIPQVLGVLRSVLSALGSTRPELAKAVLVFLVAIMVSGAAEPVLRMAAEWSASADPSLIRHLVQLMLESVAPPYSAPFARALLGLMHAGLMRRMRGGCSPAALAEFAAACRDVTFLPALSAKDQELLEELATRSSASGMVPPIAAKQRRKLQRTFARRIAELERADDCPVAADCEPDPEAPEGGPKRYLDQPGALLAATLWPLTSVAAASEGGAAAAAAAQLNPHGPQKAKELYSILLQGLPRAPWYMLNPDGWPRSLWDFLLVVFIVALLLYVPVLVAFYSSAIECSFFIGRSPVSLREPFAPPQPPPSVRFMGLTNAAFLLDIVLNFLTGVHVFNKETNMTEYCYRLRVVAWRYARTWLLLDVVSCLPGECILAALGAHRSFNLGYSNRLLKVIGLTRRAHGDPFRFMNYLPATRRNYNYSLRLVVVSASALLLALHYFACSLWLVLRLQKFPKLTWPLELGLINLATHKLSVFRCWLWSIFSVTSAMIGLGYGSYPPQTFAEAVLWTFEMIAMAAGWAIVNGFILSAVLESLAGKARYKAKLTQVRRELVARRLPTSLEERVVKYYQLRYKKDNMAAGGGLSDLAPGLKLQVALATGGAALRGCAVLRDYPQLLQRAALLVADQVAPEGTLLALPGTPQQALVFLQHGYADVYAGDTLLDTLVAGDTVGEAALLAVPALDDLPPRLRALWRRSGFSGAYWPTLFTVRALSNCSLLVLDAAAFAELLREYEGAAATLRDLGARYAAVLEELPELEGLWADAATFDPLADPLPRALAEASRHGGAKWGGVADE
ncbi:FPS1 [Scenedesmus sp. PABB004]|nr:FPS1 [Scenedesmus sp. PABB004]